MTDQKTKADVFMRVDAIGEKIEEVGNNISYLGRSSSLYTALDDLRYLTEQLTVQANILAELER